MFLFRKLIERRVTLNSHRWVFGTLGTLAVFGAFFCLFVYRSYYSLALNLSVATVSFYHLRRANLGNWIFLMAVRLTLAALFAIQTIEQIVDCETLMDLFGSESQRFRGIMSFLFRLIFTVAVPVLLYVARPQLPVDAGESGFSTDPHNPHFDLEALFLACATLWSLGTIVTRFSKWGLPFTLLVALSPLGVIGGTLWARKLIRKE